MHSTCLTCNRSFQAYPSSDRKYCSRACYKGPGLHKKVRAIPEADLRQAFEVEGLTSIEGMKRFNCPYGTLWGLIKTYGIKLQKGSPGQKRLRERGVYRCSICKEEKSLSELGDISKRRKGRTWRCRPCENRYALKLIETFTGRLSSVISMAKFRARRKGIPFEIETKDIDSLWTKQNKKCFYTNIEMTIKRNENNTISLDRLDSSKGYVLDNVVLCCSIVNRMKLDTPISEFRHWCHLVATGPCNLVPLNSQEAI